MVVNATTTLKAIAVASGESSSAAVSVYVIVPRSQRVKFENAKAGDATWAIGNPSDRDIEGFAGATSVNRGGSINFYARTASPSFTIQVYRMGWYGGVGARAAWARRSPYRSVSQPHCPMNKETARWNVRGSRTTPFTFPSINSTDYTNWMLGFLFSETDRDRRWENALYRVHRARRFQR